MTAYETMKNFKEVVENATKDLRLPTKSGAEKEPQVLLGYLDDVEDNHDENQEFPYILIRYVKDQTNEDEQLLSLKLIFGGYSRDTYGWVDLLHLMENVKAALIKKQVFDFYSLNFPIKNTIPEEQPYPYFMGITELELTIPKIEFEGDEQTWQG
ncbi:MAG: hypothetical protein AB9856_03500 [Cellulosilyticaceae bacterium]